jgi:hypothetical protein
LSNDDSFEHACRVPTLDSLPGSSRTSPIHSKDPIVAGVLSPDSLNVNDIDKGGGAVGCSPNDTKMPPAPFGGGKGGDNTIQQQERDVVSGNVVSGKDPSIKTVGISNSSSNIKINSNSNININSNSATNDGSEQGPKHKKKKSNIKSKWLDYLNSVQESNYDTDKQMEGKEQQSMIRISSELIIEIIIVVIIFKTNPAHTAKIILSAYLPPPSNETTAIRHRIRQGS